MVANEWSKETTEVVNDVNRPHAERGGSSTRWVIN